MRGGRWVAVVLAVGSISTGVAIAHGGSSETKQVMGEFEAALDKNKQQPCDANHVRLRLRFKGTQTSTDERLAGDLEVKAESVVNTDNRWGRTEGQVVVKDADRPHRTKFRGKFVGVVEPDGGAEGFILGRTKDGARLFANFNADQDPDNGSIKGEFGQDSQGSPYTPFEDQDPAVLTDACSKKHGHGQGDQH